MSVNKQISKHSHDIKLIKLQTCVIKLLGILRFLFNYEDQYRNRGRTFSNQNFFFLNLFFINYYFVILKQKDIFNVSMQ